ncbi:MAG: hypothetical protein KGL39_26290 [Patescibacteria group bacterium]|nr:hypothetical protein [Patescibacteria group bacterium]
MTVLPVAEWAPDQPDLADATSIATNVVPLTPQSYGPVLAPVEYSSNALAGTCLGMGFAEDTTATVHIFAGSATKLEILTAGASSWTDVSGTTYAASNENWRFAQYNNLEIATDFADSVQVYNMISGGSFANLTPGPVDGTTTQFAPLAKFACVTKTFLILGYTYDPVGGTNPARLWWSPSGAPAGVTSGGDTGWPVPGTTLAQQTQSDYNDMIGPQGAITGLAPSLTGCDVAIFFERGVFNGFYAGPPNIFNFYPAAAVKGCLASSSIVQLGTVVYYYGEDGFYSYDGTQALPIGTQKIDQFFAASVDQTALSLIVGAPDITNKSIVWIYRSIYAPTATQDQMLIYRWDIGRWGAGTVPLQWICRAPVPVSVGSSPLVPGQLQLAAIISGPGASDAPITTEAGTDIKTESGSDLLTEASGAGFLAYFVGTPLPAQIGTKVVQINENYRSYVGDHVRPLVNSGRSGLNLLTEQTGLIITQETGAPILTELSAAMITVAVSARNNYFDTEVFGPAVMPDAGGECPQAADGRYHRAILAIPSGIWSTAFGVDAQGIRAGQR